MHPAAHMHAAAHVHAGMHFMLRAAAHAMPLVLHGLGDCETTGRQAAGNG
jgi:hypothetical protein